jgi:hypothetical protein
MACEPVETEVGLDMALDSLWSRKALHGKLVGQHLSVCSILTDIEI